MRTRVLQTETRPLAERLLHPFQEFVRAETSSGILLLVCTALALLLANSPWASSFAHLWDLHFTLGFSGILLDQPLHIWINDGLMTLFFLLVGLEIKRELLVGELASLGQAILPLFAALGGAIVPALIYLAFNWGTPAFKGWGIPMATDIAFALGILSILGNRLPVSLKVFLTALAIFDDLIAIIMIALFYSHGIQWPALAWAGGVLCCLAGCNMAGVRRIWAYIVPGLALWLALFVSGIHATIAGVLLAMLIPARASIDPSTFTRQSREMLDEFASCCSSRGSGLAMDERQQTALYTLNVAIEKVQAPLSRMEHGLHLPVSFGIIPLFVLANAGVSLHNLGSSLLSPVSLGIAFGLVAGKQIGITLVSWLLTRSGRVPLPQQATFRQLYAVSWLGGIGFTMSLFIADLAFADGPQTVLLNEAKVGILLAFLVSGLGGFLLLRWQGNPRQIGVRNLESEASI